MIGVLSSETDEAFDGLGVSSAVRMKRRSDITSVEARTVMDLRWTRLSVRRSMLAVAILAFLLATIVVPVARLRHYHRVQREVYDAIYSLQYRLPKGITPAAWECAWSWTVTAYGNVCFSEEHVHIEELYRLHADVLPKLREPVDLQTLNWIWDRLAQTGPHGRRYVERFRPSFMDCFPPGAIPPTSPSSPPRLTGPDP